MVSGLAVTVIQDPLQPSASDRMFLFYLSPCLTKTVRPFISLRFYTLLSGTGHNNTVSDGLQ